MLWPVCSKSSIACRLCVGTSRDSLNTITYSLLYVSIHIWLSTFVMDLMCLPDLMNSIASVYRLLPAGSILVNELSKRRRHFSKFSGWKCRSRGPKTGALDMVLAMWCVLVGVQITLKLKFVSFSRVRISLWFCMRCRCFSKVPTNGRWSVQTSN